jgi:hypothetical protein
MLHVLDPAGTWDQHVGHFTVAATGSDFVLGPDAEGAAARLIATTGCPQPVQNFNPGAMSAPHFAHFCPVEAGKGGMADWGGVEAGG